ncbi:similar to Saccharomyces cerevisiae YGR026W Putative protein of unknown function [Maudiozyma saulgeensis]|uniref:Uncharacterized protein n=1 Tax=Maudiozyma saulgeensis TaxID=1789683 RepID=A0A1X7RA60_9SACH|nr:similar to Saccharomyces cerevisiae YGR026W Putative protein of unknown function [Kazachstania saulgeensis]
MVSTIQVIRKKAKSGKVADPLAKQKLVWTIGHFLTITCGLIFSITYFFHVLIFFKYRSWKWLFLRVNKNYVFFTGAKWYNKLLKWTPQILYRFALIGVIMANGITMYQNWSHLNPTWFDLLAAENFQSLAIAGLWLIGGGKSFYRLLPFMILSYMHLTNRKHEFTSDDKKIDEQKSIDNKHLLHIVAYSEIIVIMALILDTLLMKNGSAGFLLVAYSSIYWLRLNFSSYAQVTVLRILDKFGKHVPAKYREKWDSIRNFLYGKIKERSDRRKKVLRK